MQLSLLKGDVIYTCVLPEKKKGQYWITEVNTDGVEERVIGVEGIENQWVLKSNRKAAIFDNGEHVKEVNLEPRKIYSIKLKKTDEEAILLSEPNTNDRKVFKKLILPPNGKITIGRNDECDIRYFSPFTSSIHAELFISGNQLSIRDNKSYNGTFVNGTRVTSLELHPGDVIYILGLKIIIGNRYIAINNPNNQVTYNDHVFIEYEKQAITADVEEEEVEEQVTNVFFRSPRFKRDIKKKEIKIDSPPSLGNQEQTPLMLMLGPSITMGMASLFTGIVTLNNALNNGNLMTAMPTLVMSISMLIGMILWPILTRRYEGKKKRKDELARQEKYKAYLNDTRNQIAKETEHQRKILHENHITINECMERIKQRKRNLWERTHIQNDFLTLRLGLGTLPLEVDLKVPEKKFSLEDDLLKNELDRLVEEPRNLEQVPISLSLIEDWICGIIGKREHVLPLVKSLIFQTTALHSYDEVKLVFLYNHKESEKWEFVKWLPHVWDDNKVTRYIATNLTEVKEVSSFFEKELAERERISNSEDLKSITPYYLIFAMDKGLATKAEMINMVLKHKKNHGISLIHLYDELMNLPKECSIVVQHDGDEAKIYDKDDITGEYISFQADKYLDVNEMELAKSLANIQLDSTLSKFTLPTMLTFLDMFEVGKIEHLNALTRWKENDPTRTLQTPIGVDTSGEKFYLDLHEKFHGPHGLIAGMTGSGKSEVIMTYILSLAVNYHPHEVAFILIDYKGGGMANAFTDLPHLAGTITNLDGSAVKRSLISIQSELKRRQAIFGEASKTLNVSNIDIYKYQKLFREGQVSEPLQHLFIISDEFAELKTQQPEFMEQLVSAARIGRSLGVHLILATQKPSGVVDDQIWSNSKFRICLKVQEKADSMDVIKRPDAAELSVTGRFFVQVGFNELFDLGQSAWGGAPYYPSERVEKKIDDSVVVIDKQGRLLKEVKINKRQMMVTNPQKQIDEINKYLSGIAKEENIRVRPLWLEPIPQKIYLNELKEKYKVTRPPNFEINPVIGEIDDPANQRQLVMTFPLSKEGNAVIYGSATSGKSTFLRTLIYSLMQDHSAAELNLYLLDFGSETLRAFSKAPHVGDVLLSHEAEKVNNLFKMLYQEVEQRKKQFSDYGGDYQSYRKATKTTLASIVIVIHNIAGFTEMFEDKEEALGYLTREGLKYGIYFIVTAANTGAVRYRLLQNFKQLFVLQLNDTSDYSGVLGNIEGVYPSKLKGRGIYKTDQVYEFQIALVHQDLDNILEYIRNYCDNLAKKSHMFAKRIPTLPDKVDSDFLMNEIKNSPDGRIPVGVEKNRLEISYFEYNRSYINLVLSQNNEKADFVQGLAELLIEKGNSTVTVLDPEDKFLHDSSKTYSYQGKKSDYDQTVVEMFNLLVLRNNTYKEALTARETAPCFEKQIYIITSLSALQIRLSADSKDKLKILLEKGDRTYNVHFFICESVSYLSTVSFEPWFKTHLSMKDGIWIGNGITNQYQFKLNKITNDMYQEIGEDFGYMIKSGNTSLVKLLTSCNRNVEVML
ncbi:type VII secretion protein EssC [Neobacillus sp. PS2-9]|uniref:type VII secretion protein EssC n=1 Tax=Neobacillus sp. PS2-9 TaxID=3070676 RepID=UPI0027DF38AE|nr:type VII secretion protein EssC [Neobacillus sp. PS2-9]WML60550.1 type VII secretion protein EssC [Neobacillus sp. PS2-9]